MADFDLTPEVTVGAVVASFPATMRMLEALGIDYCCGGKRTLADAASSAGVPVETVLAVLRTTILQAQQAPGVERNWQTAPLDELMDHIVATHHAYLKHELPRITEMLARVCRAHGASHGDILQPLAETYAQLRDELMAHLNKEETVTFPAIRRLLAGETGEDVRQGLSELEHEHEAAGAALARMREVTGNYKVPADACTTYCALYDALQGLEADLHQHISLENNILFPRARQLAASRGMAA